MINYKTRSPTSLQNMLGSRHRGAELRITGVIRLKALGVIEVNGKMSCSSTLTSYDER